MDTLANTVRVCPVLPSTSAEVTMWDKYGPQRTKRCFMEFDVPQKMLRRSGSTQMNIHTSLIHCAGKAHMHDCLFLTSTLRNMSAAAVGSHEFVVDGFAFYVRGCVTSFEAFLLITFVPATEPWVNAIMAQRAQRAHSAQ